MGMWGEIPRAGRTRRAMAVMIQALRRIRPGVGIINPIRRNQEVGVARDRVGVGPRRRDQEGKPFAISNNYEQLDELFAQISQYSHLL